MGELVSSVWVAAVDYGLRPRVFAWVNYEEELPPGVWGAAPWLGAMVLLAATGVGLILHRRWASVLFALATILFGVSMIVAVIRDGIRLEDTVTYVVMGLVVAVFPAGVTFTQWDRLR